MVAPFMRRFSPLLGSLSAFPTLAVPSSSRADDASATATGHQDIEAHASPPSPNWTADYHDDLFFLRSPDDAFCLYVKARVHAGSSLNDGFSCVVRVSRWGENSRQVQWQLEVEFAPSGGDKPGATTANQACAVDPTTAALNCSNRESAVDSA